MMPEIHEYYDWNNLINRGSRMSMCNDVNTLISQGDVWTNSPKYQTNVNMFGLANENWTNLKMSFIFSCFAFMKREVKIKNIQSWSYRTSLKDAEDRDTLWHHHDHNPDTTTVSGVYYMHLPIAGEVVGPQTAGTELAPNGPEGDGKYFTPWREGHWMIYPGKIWHRPGILHTDEDRYIVAADMEF
ncbi:MAG: hypothetical protein ACKVJK_03350 [Methylophagaceae bacterium]|jgi:hypothetical protein|tara:strand:- start:3534 stop:4091 length:558 start_codon:yes stop_codon:yes gene_type:complete